MNLIKRQLCVFLLLPMMLIAQRTEVIGFELRKSFLEGEEDRLVVGVRLPDLLDLVSITKESTLDNFMADDHIDLLAAANKSSKEPINYIDFEQSRILPDSLGFLLVLNLPVLPPKGSCKLNFRLTLIALEKGANLSKQVHFKDLILAGEEALLLEGRNVAFNHYRFNDSRTGTQYRVQFDNTEFKAEIQEILNTSDTDKPGEPLKLYKYPDKTAFNIPNLGELNNLMMTYMPLSTKKIELNLSFDMGL